MSMKVYTIEDYGLVLDEDIINDIASQIFEDYTENTDIYWGYELYEQGICEYIGEFTGATQTLKDDGTDDWSRDIKDYSVDAIFYIPVSKYPTLFKKAYNNMDEIVEEFKGKIGEYLSKDFDYRSSIRHIVGTYYG